MSKEEHNEIIELAKQINELALLANEQFAGELNAIITGQIKDPGTIENLLDRMLDFANHENIFMLYKKLCRYYFTINPEATVSYISTYRDLWDNGEDTNGENVE